MDFEQITTELADGALTITLNRHDRLNAWTAQMGLELRTAFDRADADDDVRAIIVTGAGRGFCAGGDVKGMAARGDGTVGDNTIDGAIHRQRVNQRATAGKLFTMPKPTLAALPGAAAGAGRFGGIGGIWAKVKRP